MQVVDWEKSEKEPQRRRGEDYRPLHCCCICYALSVWDGGWSCYASVKEMDDGAAIPKFCSDKCRTAGGPNAKLVTRVMKEKAREMELRPPERAYREATTAERYAHEADKQKRRRAAITEIKSDSGR